MRVLIGALADAAACRALARCWLEAGCPAARLHLFVRVGVALDALPAYEPPVSLVRLGRQGELMLWALELPSGERSRSTRRHRRLRRALTLLGRLVFMGPVDRISRYHRALDDGCPLGVVRVARSQDAGLIDLARPLLAHAAESVHLLDLVANSPEAEPARTGRAGAVRCIET